MCFFFVAGSHFYFGWNEKKLNAIEIESWYVFLYSFLMYTHWRLIVGYGCWWGRFHSWFSSCATLALCRDLNFCCPRSLMTLTGTLRGRSLCAFFSWPPTTEPKNLSTFFGRNRRRCRSTIHHRKEKSTMKFDVVQPDTASQTGKETRKAREKRGN